MKKSILLAFTLVSTFSLAQIGINTNSPTKTLDVSGDMRIRTLDIMYSKIRR